MTNETFPDQAPSSENQADLQPKLGSVDFVFCTHSEENSSRIVDAIVASDGDIIALEKARPGSFGMGTREEKKLMSERMTDFISVGNSNTEAASRYFETDQPFYTQLLDRLKGTGKRIVLIDRGTDDPSYSFKKIVGEKLQTLEGYEKTIEDNPVQSSELYDNYNHAYYEYVLASAQETKERELLMRQQIRTLIAENPGMKVTVAAGAAHTPISYGMNADFDVNRIFVPTEEEAAPYDRIEKMRFDKEETDIRRARHDLAA